MPRSPITGSASSHAHAPARRPAEDLRALVRGVQRGDEEAWTRLVRRFEPGVREIARSYRLAPADVDDVLQACWLRLHRHVARLREPEALAGWLSTTMRREALRVLQRPVAELPTDDPLLGDVPDPGGLDSAVIAAERRAVLARALRTLAPRHRRLMVLLAWEATADYATISRMLAIPRGSIGPVRARCLARLADDPGLRALMSAA
jgi:RNA polymerase sigma factor (sigma-70 family)